MSVDGYVLDYEIAGWGCEKKFSKPHKLKRFLDEQMELLKELKTKILETELSWEESQVLKIKEEFEKLKMQKDFI